MSRVRNTVGPHYQTWNLGRWFGAGLYRVFLKRISVEFWNISPDIEYITGEVIPDLEPSNHAENGIGTETSGDRLVDEFAQGSEKLCDFYTLQSTRCSLYSLYKNRRLFWTLSSRSAQFRRLARSGASLPLWYDLLWVWFRSWKLLHFWLWIKNLSKKKFLWYCAQKRTKSFESHLKITLLVSLKRSCAHP